MNSRLIDPADDIGVRSTLATVCIATDRMDWDLLASCFLSDAGVDFGDFARGSISEYIANNRSENGLPSLDRTMHALSTTDVRVDGDTAKSESYCVCYHSGPEDHPWCRGFVVVYMRYLDRLIRREEGWLIAQRVGVFEWGRNETTGEPLTLSPEMLGRRDRQDPRYTF